MLIGTLGVVVVLFIGWFYRHQVLLRDRAHLMREAIRNEEFTFRLPVKGLFSENGRCRKPLTKQVRI